VNPNRFVFLTTEDGSPTLQMTKNSGVSEKMHHFRGAFSESLYIYHKALQLIANQGLPLRAVSVGLGLGYNEMIWAAQTLTLDSKSMAESYLDSYEILPELIDQFRNWIHTGPVHPEFRKAYEEISNRVEDTFHLTKGELRLALSQLETRRKLRLNGEFALTQRPQTSYNVILYDAFSRKMDPDLWEERDLIRFLAEWTESTSIFTTYASTGALKRALSQSGFIVEVRPGFGGKKESILGYRGLLDKSL